MIFLALGVVASCILYVLFKFFDKYNVNLLQAIIVNYFVAFSLGILTNDSDFTFSVIHKKDWFIGALFLAVLFITVFNLMGITAQKNGVTITAIASKMAVSIPIIAGVILYNESLNFIKLLGILLAFIAVYLSSKKEKSTTHNNASLIFPLLVFFGSGIIDTSLKYVQSTSVPKEETALFSGVLFGLAGIIGFLFFVLKPKKVQLKNIVGGIVLGFFNYYSIYYLLVALESTGMQSSEIYPINNVAVVMLSTVAGIVFFKEKLNSKNTLGVVFAIISILLISSDQIIKAIERYL